MSTIDQIEEAIRALGPKDLAALRAWFADYDAQAWDRQLQADASAGRLDAFVQEAMRDLDEGRCTPP